MLKRIALLLVLGAAVNVLVAWGCAAQDVRPPGLSYRAMDAGKREWDAAFGTSVYIEHEYEAWAVEEDAPPSKDFGTMTFCLIESIDRGFGVGCLRLRDTLRSPPPRLMVLRAGWPMLSLRGRAAHAATRACHCDLLVLGTRSSGSGLTESLYVPLRPMWLGFAVNTVFYAAVLWLLLFMPFDAQRWRRKCKGLCVRCAYDLRGVASEQCPECGALR